VTAPGARYSAQPHPEIKPRLVIGQSGRRPLRLAEEHAAGSYARVETDALIAELERAGLRGRGGAGFPAHIKWRAVASADRPRVVVANGEEGEPASYKDRWLLTHRPHAVIDGLLVAAATVKADRSVLYLSHPETIRAVRWALAELPVAVADRIEVHRVRHRYVAGEESAVCRAINGGPALPLAKPPRVFESGVDGRPTLVSNVETLVHAAWIARHGAAEYRRYGTGDSRGTGLVTFSGAGRRSSAREPFGVFEVPYGRTLRELLDTCCGGVLAGSPGLLMGGWFGGIADVSVLDTAWCYDSLRAAGSSLGCGAVTVLGPTERLADVAARLAAWYAAESAQQCGVCREGTEAIADVLARIRADQTDASDLPSLSRWGTSLRGRGACAFLDGAANLARSMSELIGTHPALDYLSAS
jgi:NADH:ubiquinone oxidoreductase subunit F (NADH-binding)